MKRIMSCIALKTVFICAIITGLLYAEEANNGQLNHLQKAGIGLMNRIEEKSDDEMIRIYLVLNQQYDTDILYQEVKNLPKPLRREHTVNNLKDFSSSTQKDIRSLIESLEKDNQVDELRYLWITNVIGMKATIEAIKILDQHPDINLIEYDPLQYLLIDYDNSESRRRNKPEERNKPSDAVYRNPAENVSHINAPAVWGRGYGGQGVVVSVIDTGVNYNHHDIRNNMWTHPNYPHHGYNTFDNNNNTFDDDSGHGTHCAGTVAGDGTSGTITGVAPRATIMAVKCLGSGGGGTSQSVWEAIQFSVAYGADILSISLGWPNASNQVRTIYRRVLANTLNAGVIAAIAAGNGPRGLRSPADCPPPWLHPDQTIIGGLTATVAVGATDLNNQIASFSSLGPVTWQTVAPYFDYPRNPGIGLIKPDICAVGVDVLSLVHNNNTGYTRKNGTSMSTPAIAGVMALMLSKNPNLTPEEISRILEETAIPLSETKSNIFGSGLVDPVAAVDASYIAINDFSFSDGNNDIPEYGEIIDINMSLINLYSQEAENITAVLSTTDQYIDILQNTANFGDIEQDSIVTVNNAFSVQIAGNTPNGHKVVFNLNIRENENSTGNMPFIMTVSAPALVKKTPLVYDKEPGGDNNGLIDPGEEAIVYIPIKNIGKSISPPLNITITSQTDMVDIIDIPQAQYQPIRVDETIYASMKISVSEQAEYEQLLSFNYTYQTGEYVFEGIFTVIIGGVVPVQLGTGERATGREDANPISIFYPTLRSQTIYTAAELNNANVFGELPITRLGYYVTNAPAYPLINFKMRMKHSDADIVIRHDSGPFITVYQNNSYTPTAGGWDMLTLQEPFLWNGVDNILIDTAFAPVQSWSPTGRIRYYEVNDGFRYSRADNLDQTDEPTREDSHYKPQILFLFGTIAGELAKPNNLSAELSVDGVHLQWEAPVERRSEQQPEQRHIRRAKRYSQRDVLLLRNPDGYHIYRNGIRLNDELVAVPEYFDDNINIGAAYYYYATAVYEEAESQPSNIVQIRIKTLKPRFTPSSPIQHAPFELTISCDMPEVFIYYTVDGNEPTQESNLYVAPIEINSRTIVKAVAYKDGWPESDVSTMEYFILYTPDNLEGRGQVNAVYLSWNAPNQRFEDNYSSHDNVSTRNRSTNTRRRRRESLYHFERDSEIQNNQSRNLIGYNLYRSTQADSFRLVNNGPITEEEYLDNNIPLTGQLRYYVTALYDVGESFPSNQIDVQSIVSKPQLSHSAGEYEEPFNLSMSVLTGNAAIFYTVDGTNPNENSIQYIQGQPININTTLTVKAIGILSGWQNSTITEAVFELPSDVDSEELYPVYATELLNAYPNPFNPQTNIQFILREPDRVRIEIYNISGQRVNLLLDEMIERGKHQVVWYGNDNQGKNLSSGIYFYKMITSEYTNTKKLVILK